MKWSKLTIFQGLNFAQVSSQITWPEYDILVTWLYMLRDHNPVFLQPSSDIQSMFLTLQVHAVTSFCLVCAENGCCLLQTLCWSSIEGPRRFIIWPSVIMWPKLLFFCPSIDGELLCILNISFKMYLHKAATVNMLPSATICDHKLCNRLWTAAFLF